MSSTEQLIEVLGVPQPAPTGDFDAVQDALGIGAPLEVKKVCSIYGDFLISDFLFILGPRFMLEKNQWMSDFVREGHPAIPRAVLPDVGGMLHWGHSIEGDQFFLEDRGGGRWTVSAFRRNWGDWYESDETLVNWLLGVFHGHTASEWMPEWPREHWFEPA